MKIVKVRIRSGDHTKGEDAMVYPARYDPIEVDRMGAYATKINHAGVSLSGGLSRGEPEEFCLIMLPDALANEYALDPDMTIITDLEADTLMEQWRVDNNIPQEMVTDINRIEAIKAKQATGITPSQEDMDALDPTKPIRGINKVRESMSEVRRRLVKATKPQVA